MKKGTILLIFVILACIIYVYFYLNETGYLKDKKIVYAFEVGSFNDYNNAKDMLNTLPNGIIIKDNNSYVIYVGIYNNIDVMSKMLVYFEDKKIHINLKNIDVLEEYYDLLNNYELILSNSNNELLYEKVNQKILNSYLESSIL